MQTVYEMRQPFYVGDGVPPVTLTAIVTGGCYLLGLRFRNTSWLRKFFHSSFSVFFLVIFMNIFFLSFAVYFIEFLEY